MIPRTPFLAIALLAPTSLAAQPFSHSMADCAAVYQNAAQWVAEEANADKLMRATNAWADAAIAQARSEGTPEPHDTMWTRIDTKTEEWEAKGADVFFSQDFRDWTSYCKSFAKAQGIRIEG